MTSDVNDPTLRNLRRLTVLEPERARSERVRMRCHAAISERRRQGERQPPPKRFRAVALETGLTYGLSVGYFFAMIDDVLRLYMRR